jgi:2-octaprenyl-6-methoxyphenol hydroxylase
MRLPRIRQTSDNTSMSSLATQIAVVGAGPVGLAAAALIADLGYDVALVAPPAPPDERTSALMAGSVALLERLRVWPEIAPASAPLRTLRIVDATGRLIRAPEVAFDASEIGLAAFGHNIANAALLAALEKAVAARPVRRLATLVESATPGDDAVALRLASGEEIAARLVIAADGRKSKLREAAAIAADEWSYPQAALVVNLRHTAPHDGTSTEFHTRKGPFTLVPLPGNRASLVWVDTPDESRRRLALDDAALAAEIETQSSSILGAVAIDGRRQVFPLSGMAVRRFADRRIMLAGEAAHVIPPIGAQGLNLGYRDVSALADVLSPPAFDPKIADPGEPTRLAAYDRARRADVVTRTAAVDALNRTLLAGFLPVDAVRAMSLFAIDRVPLLRRFAMRQGVGASF